MVMKPMSNRAAALFSRVKETPDATALIFDDIRFSYALLAAMVRHRAGALAALGIQRGDRVGLWLASTPDFIVTQQALFMLGAVVTPINVLYSAEDVAHAVSCCHLDAIITTSNLGRGLRHTPPCSLISLDAPTDEGDIRSVREAAATAAPLITMTDVGGHDLAMLLLTSATTGKAKGVMLTPNNLAANYDRTPGWLGLDSRSVIYCGLPLYNTFGLNQGINAMLQTGCVLVLSSRFEAGACIAAIAKYGCTFLPAVPTMLQKILDHPAANQETLGSLRTIMTGGAPVPSALLRRLLELAPDVEVLTGYGLTEATALVTLTSVRLNSEGGIDRERTIGKTLDGISLAFVDDAGQFLPRGETGEIVIHGPNVMAGYFRSPEDNAAALKDGWLRTGDVGYQDDAGYTYIVDRKKDVIIRGGQNIYPTDIEEVLYAFPGVVEAAVVGSSDALMGEVPIAFVSLCPDGSHATIEEIADHCRSRLAAYKRPVTIEIRDELPKGPTGKILRRALRACPLTA